MNKISSIQDDQEYQSALHEVSVFVDNEPAMGSQAEIRFESLLKAIENYESKNYAI